jgi:hypothetical protein
VVCIVISATSPRRLRAYKKTRLFLSFPHVSPEPVLAKMIIQYKMAQKDAFYFLPSMGGDI